MSNHQQAMIAETVLAIRKTLKRKAYESDSDSSIEHNTNRGNKLKKRSRFVRQGRLAPPNGPASYKEIAEHAGYHRAIINQNPLLIDEEGYELDSDDDEERIQETIEASMAENPYSSIHLEQLLAPLTAVTDLPNHPTLSRPFTSKALTELVTQGRNLMHRENAALWKAKPLQTKLVGDNTWAPCGLMIGDLDHELFTETERFTKRPALPDAVASSSNGAAPGTSPTNAGEKPNSDAAHNRAPVDGPDGETEGQSKGKETDATDSDQAPGVRAEINGRPDAVTNGSDDIPKDGQVNGNSGSNPEGTDAEGEKQTDGAVPKVEEPTEDVQMADTADVAAAPEPPQPNGSRPPSVAAETPEELFIHPLFLPPRAAHPDRDLFLPENEAEDVRRLLQLYVQKQEEVCRGTKKLYESLLKADRYRITVMQWAKAEAHVGELSDGEDWYDKEEWGLPEDLKKGEDEVEEDTTQTQKKTRNRK
ncbi:hypothetical protein OQA88_10149 [Cercophora sp. LCS_1]